MASDNLQVQYKTQVYRLMMKWGENDVQNRTTKDCLTELFKFIRIGCLPNQFLMDVVTDNKLMLSQKVAFRPQKVPFGSIWDIMVEVAVRAVQIVLDAELEDSKKRD